MRRHLTFGRGEPPCAGGHDLRPPKGELLISTSSGCVREDLPSVPHDVMTGGVGLCAVQVLHVGPGGSFALRSQRFMSDPKQDPDDHRPMGKYALILH